MNTFIHNDNYLISSPYGQTELFTKDKINLLLSFLLVITVGLNFSLSQGDALLLVMNKLTRILMAVFCIVGMVLYSKTDPIFGKRYRSWFSLSFFSLFLWIFYTLFFAKEPDNASQTFYSMLYLLICYSFLFYFIESKRMLTAVLLKYTIIFLAINYGAVIIFPGIAIHSDGNLVGLWRGALMHKNTAGPVFAFNIFMGIYLYKNNYKLHGLVTIILASIFTYNSGSKTVLFVVFIIALIVQIAFYFNSGIIRSIILLTPLSVISAVTITSVFNFQFADYLHSYNIPTDYTGRDKLWVLASELISTLEHHGMGLGAYLLTEEGDFYKTNVNLEISWADNFHNGYFETYVSLGLTGFILALIFFLYTPLRAIHKAIKLGNDKSVVILFSSLWLLLLHSATMESVFFGHFNPSWAIFIASIFALRRLALDRLPE